MAIADQLSAQVKVLRKVCDDLVPDVGNFEHLQTEVEELTKVCETACETLKKKAEHIISMNDADLMDF
ncbi:hypothetical protein ACFL1X_11100 [Candidatus Hydrogenedentota bacterium]